LSFQIYPAIDLRRGGAVRLRQGSASEEFRYSEDPVAVARAFREAGARALHVVDLDGAAAGRALTDLVDRLRSDDRLRDLPR